MIPAGFGLIFHGYIADALTDNGLPVIDTEVWKSLIIPGSGMIIGLLIAVFITYRKPRNYEDKEVMKVDSEYTASTSLTKAHIGALLGAVSAFVIQITVGSLPLGAIVGLTIMLVFGAFGWKEMNEIMNGGIGIMGFIAFVMLVAAGYGEVIRATGGVESLVEASVSIMGGSKLIAAIVMLLIGLVITMGIGTSFGTVPILAAIFVPLALQLGFSTPAIIALVGTAGALGDAGSPASDSTLGPTAGLNVDGQHDHITDTVIPTFMHYNIPLIIMGTIAAMVL
jgi:predicted histidine transporter YuiF (NhaC family)